MFIASVYRQAMVTLSTNKVVSFVFILFILILLNYNTLKLKCGVCVLIAGQLYLVYTVVFN